MIHLTKSNLLLTFVLFLSNIVTSAYGDGYDPAGEYWYGWISANVIDASPWATSGTLTWSANEVTILWDEPDGQGSSQRTVTATGFDADGWFIIDSILEGTPDTVIVATNDSAVFHASRTPSEGNNLGMTISVRKATGLTSSDIVGEYSFFEHNLDWPNESPRDALTAYGGLTFNPDGTGTLSFVESDGTSGGATAGTWSFDSASGTVTGIDDATGDTQVMHVGADGQILMMFDTDYNTNDNLGYNFFVRKGASLTPADIAGRYLIQLFETKLDGTPYTGWGTADLSADGTFLVNATYSDGAEETFSAAYTIDPDGTFYLTHDLETTEGVISLDGELIFLPDLTISDPAESWIGGIYLIKPVPEPGVLSLLALGSLALLRRRRLLI